MRGNQGPIGDSPHPPEKRTEVDAKPKQAPEDAAEWIRQATQRCEQGGNQGTVAEGLTRPCAVEVAGRSPGAARFGKDGIDAVTIGPDQRAADTDDDRQGPKEDGDALEPAPLPPPTTPALKRHAVSPRPSTAPAATARSIQTRRCDTHPGRKPVATIPIHGHGARLARRPPRSRGRSASHPGGPGGRSIPRCAPEREPT